MRRGQEVTLIDLDSHLEALKRRQREFTRELGAVIVNAGGEVEVDDLDLLYDYEVRIERDPLGKHTLRARRL